MFHNVFTFFSVYNCLDEEFDAPDAAADSDLCRAIVAGKSGVHPDAWGNHDPHQLRWLLRKRPWPGEVGEAVERVHHPSPADLRWEAQHRRRPVVWERPRPRTPVQAYLWRLPDRVPIEDTIDGYGWIRLTCDECGKASRLTMRYPAGERPTYVAMIRHENHKAGWTHIVGRDRCPECSTLQAAAPETVGNGAGERQRHE